MKKSLLLILVYFAIQIVFGSLTPLIMSSLFSSGDAVDAVVPALILSNISMMAVLFVWGGLSYKSVRKLVPAKVACLSVVAGFSAIFLTDMLSSFFDFLPNMMEDTFSSIENNFWGIAAITVIGPVMEEMLFRGAITSELAKHNTSQRAVLYSGLLFGIFHINPAQIIPAMCMGFLLAWLYLKSGSLVPGVIIHVLNNSLSVFLSLNYPSAESLYEILGLVVYLACLIATGGLLFISISKFRRWFA